MSLARRGHDLSQGSLAVHPEFPRVMPLEERSSPLHQSADFRDHHLAQPTSAGSTWTQAYEVLARLPGLRRNELPASEAAVGVDRRQPSLPASGLDRQSHVALMARYGQG